MHAELNGLAAKTGVTEKDVDPAQLSLGQAVEMEHTDDPDVAMTIALDHLAEHPKYYDALKEMEDKLKGELISSKALNASMGYRKFNRVRVG